MATQVDRLYEVEASTEFIWTIVQTAQDVKLVAQIRAYRLMVRDDDRAARLQFTELPETRPDLKLAVLGNFAEGTSLTLRTTVTQRGETEKLTALECEVPGPNDEEDHLK